MSEVNFNKLPEEFTLDQFSDLIGESSRFDAAIKLGAFVRKKGTHKQLIALEIDGKLLPERYKTLDDVPETLNGVEVDVACLRIFYTRS